MRILHVIDTLQFGGAEKVLVSLANAAAERHEVAVCCLRGGGPLARELDPRIEVFDMGKGEGDDLMLPFALARRIAGRHDVVHTHNWAAFLEGGIAARRARVPVAVHTVHGPYGAARAGLLPRAKRALRHAVERRVARGFRHIVAVSDAIREYIPDTVGIEASRVTTIHNGIAGMASPRGEASAAPVFVAVGRLDPVKNQALMLRAFARVLAQSPDARLRLVGDGPSRASLQALATELGIASCVEFCGFRSDVAALLADADVFLLSSHYEGISIALLEAMRAGLPTVATRVGGVSETVVDGRTGVLVADGDLESFAAAMSRMAADPSLRRAMGDAARRHQRDEFSLDRMLQRYEALYRAA